jgi:hypothetical protein
MKRRKPAHHARFALVFAFQGDRSKSLSVPEIFVLETEFMPLFGRLSPGKGRSDSAPEPRHRLEGYAMLHCLPECRAISRNAS